MKIFLYFLTMVFGIVCFGIIKKKRYKVMPLIYLIMFICFIGCGIVSLVYSFVPYGEIFVMLLVSIVFGLIFIWVGVNDLYSLLCYREKVNGVYCGYNTYYGDNITADSRKNLECYQSLEFLRIRHLTGKNQTIQTGFIDYR